MFPNSKPVRELKAIARIPAPPASKSGDRDGGGGLGGLGGGGAGGFGLSFMIWNHSIPPALIFTSNSIKAQDSSAAAGLGSEGRLIIHYHKENPQQVRMGSFQ